MGKEDLDRCRSRSIDLDSSVVDEGEEEDEGFEQNVCDEPEWSLIYTSISRFTSLQP